MLEKNPDSEKHLNFKERLILFWERTQDYRFGFLLGCLSIGVTLFLIFSGRKDEVRSFKTQESVNETPVKTSQVLSSVSALKNEEPETPISPSKKLIPKSFNLNKKVNVNKDPIGVLDSLPKIGPTIAGRIVEYREKNGAFRSLSDLDKVKGIGQKTLESIKDLIEF